MLGFNVFAYCANNPIMYMDVAGESITIVIFKVVFTLKELLAISAALAALITMSTPAFRRWFNNAVNTAVAGLKTSLKAIVKGASWVYSKAKAIGKSIANSFAKAKSIPKYIGTTEKHHVVAKRAKNAKYARKVLADVGIGINDPENLISLKTGLHRRLHTDLYYGWANSVVIAAYNAAGGNEALQTVNVYAALEVIKAFLRKLNAKAPF